MKTQLAVVHKQMVTFEHTDHLHKPLGWLDTIEGKDEGDCRAEWLPQPSAQWCQHEEKVSGPENTSKHPNLLEVCFLALFLWL